VLAEVCRGSYGGLPIRNAKPSLRVFPLLEDAIHDPAMERPIPKSPSRERVTGSSWSGKRVRCVWKAAM